MVHTVLFSPEARDDPLLMYSYIADQSGPERAIAYLGRIEAYCRSFSKFPERGTKRDDLFSGLRVVGFERRVTLAFHVTDDTVVFDRILYAGREMTVRPDEE